MEIQERNGPKQSFGGNFDIVEVAGSTPVPPTLKAINSNGLCIFIFGYILGTWVVGTILGTFGTPIGTQAGVAVASALFQACDSLPPSQ